MVLQPNYTTALLWQRLYKSYVGASEMDRGGPRNANSQCGRLAYCSVALSSHRCACPCSRSDVLLNSNVQTVLVSRFNATPSNLRALRSRIQHILQDSPSSNTSPAFLMQWQNRPSPAGLPPPRWHSDDRDGNGGLDEQEFLAFFALKRDLEEEIRGAAGLQKRALDRDLRASDWIGRWSVSSRRGSAFFRRQQDGGREGEGRQRYEGCDAMVAVRYGETLLTAAGILLILSCLRSPEPDP